MRRSQLARVLSTVALTCALLTSCGGEEQSAVCDDVDALRTSLTSLQAFNITDTNVLADLRVVLDQIRTEVDQLSADASEEYSTEIDAVKASTDDLEASAEAAVADPTQAALKTLADDVRTFSTSFKDLRAAVGDAC
ncbi:MAG TPA: hypothetical protein VFY11_06830 [Nocardioidaceae bacterium]|nr:hypothetical protein [Nocardioidaceae bacterium]